MLRVATLNIWNRSGDWEARLPRVRAALVDLGPDLLGLQEVMYEEAVDGSGVLASQALQIAEGLGYHVVHGAALAFGDDGERRWVFGNALLSRTPVLDHETVDLPVGPDPTERRSLLAARVAPAEGTGPARSVYVTHLNWRFEESAARLRQVLAIEDVVAARRASEPDSPPALLLGDLNAEPDSDEVRWLTGRAVREGRSTYFLDVWRHALDPAGRELPGHTFDPRNPHARETGEHARRIDYVLVHGGPDDEGRARVADVRLWADEPAPGADGTPVWASDHLGVTADLTTGAEQG